MAAVREAERGSRAVMLRPMRALVNDKFDYMRSMYGDHLTVVRATGEYSDQVGTIYTGQYDLALLTYEKFLNIVTGTPWVLRGMSLVVVDEAQNISDPTRGPSLEFLLTLLRSGHARGGAPQIVALSAVIGETHGMERWLDAGLLKTDQRPVPLRESVVDSSGHATHLMPDQTISDEQFVTPEWVVGGQGSKQIVIPLVRKIVGEDKKVIVFRSFKGETVGTALYLSTALGLPPAASVLSQLSGGDLSAASTASRQALQGGVGFHNSDLSALERAALERTFRDPSSDLKVIVATTTLAMGINTPAEAVVVAGLTHPGPTQYTVAEYKNMVGRAGRTGYATEGELYIVAIGNPAPNIAWQRYVLGSPEDIASHFLDATTDPQTLILRSLVALGGSVERQELIDLLENSFAIWQRVDVGGSGWDAAQLSADVDALAAGDLIDLEPTGLVTVTQLGRFAGESGIEVRSVTRVSSILRFANQQVPVSVADVVALAQVTVEMDDVYLPVHSRSRQEQRRWPQTLQMMGVNHGILNGFHVGGGIVLDRAKKAVAALRFASSLPMARIEADLMQHMRDRSAAGPIRAVAGRTRDVLDAVAMVCQFRGFTLANEAELTQMGMRLEIGLPAELGALASLHGMAMSRTNYLELLARGVTTQEQLEALGNDEIRALLGDDVAALVTDRSDTSNQREAGDDIVG
jgi:helicase